MLVYTITFLPERGGFVGEIWGNGLQVVHTTILAPSVGMVGHLLREECAKQQIDMPQWVAFEPQHITGARHEERHEFSPANEHVNRALAESLGL